MKHLGILVLFVAMLGFPKASSAQSCGEVSVGVNPTTGLLSYCNAGIWTAVPLANGGVPAGMIGMIVTGSCPSSWTQVTALNGVMLQGTIAANGDVGQTGGSNSITATGTVSTPTFTGAQGTTSATSGGTPAGTNGTVSFTPAGTNGTASFTPAGTNGTTTTGATTGGTPAGTISALTTGPDSSTTGGVAKAIAQTPTFTGSALATHTHTVPAETFTGSSGTVPAETFTGSSGTVPAETFTGSSLATHTHTLTPSGTVSQPTLTMNSFDPHPSFVKVIFCSKN